MVVSDSDMLSHQGEVGSPLGSDRQPKNEAGLSSLGRQSSIYSLTLDEFQNTLCESGKSFGSMNMDEFLNSIWTAEENQAQATSTAAAAAVLSTNINQSNAIQLSLKEANNINNSAMNHKGVIITRQPSLGRQGSLTLPGPLSRKTVEEVWAEIHKTTTTTQRQEEHPLSNPPQNPGSSQQQQQQRQVTFGEMTLEDFLVRAGVVREQCQPPALHQQPPQPPPPPPPPPPLPHYGSFYPNNNGAIIASGGFVPRPPVMSLGGGSAVAGYQAMAQAGTDAPSAAVYPISMKRSGGGNYAAHGQQPTAAACFGGSGGGGGFGQVLGSPVSPASSDGFCGANQYGMDVGVMRRGSGGRKRSSTDGPIEKVVERRQRRMIKNRESAARSRARKQAYTVELEAELNQLKEENAHLRQALAEAEREERHQLNNFTIEETKPRASTRAQRGNEKIGVMRRTSSCPGGF